MFLKFVGFILILITNHNMTSFALQKPLTNTIKRTVIVGGGIHGISIAYFLAIRGEKVLMIESEKLAAAASSKAGGFLAREWGSGPTIPLHQKSFDLHEELANKLNINSFRRIPTLSVSQSRSRKSTTNSNEASWLDGSCRSQAMDGATAQVTPKEYCDKVFNAAVETGNLELLIGKCKGIEIDEDGIVEGVYVKKNEEMNLYKGDKFVIAAGPWSGHIVEDWFGCRLPMTGIKSTSVVYNNVREAIDEPYALFCDEDTNSCHLEIYPRNDGSLYICGIGGSNYIDNDMMREGGECATPSLIQANPSRVDAAQKSFASMTSIGKRQKADVVQACMRPCPPDAMPCMGKIPKTSNAFISAGHNCWGILWGPVSGLIMSELLLEGRSKCVDIEAFKPSRFGVVTPVDSMRGSRGRHMGDQPVGEQW